MKITDAKFVVIGGQYNLRYCGCAKTLIGAKRIANRNEEFWDNHQGWHTPKVYAIEDVIIRGDKYDPNDLYDCEVVPKEDACVLYGGDVE